MLCEGDGGNYTVHRKAAAAKSEAYTHGALALQKHNATRIEFTKLAHMASLFLQYFVFL